jgi:predicted Zn-dependent peptidase
MEFVSHTLPNGLQIVGECNGDAASAAVGFFVQTGSRDETDAEAGVSHFLEHMMFKGTPTRSAADVNREFDEMGAYYNAFTNEENTVYYAAVLPEFQDRAVELLGDMLRPALREDDFDTEKQVILEEIQMYEDQPPFGADEKVRALYFGSHPLGRSVLGTPQSVGDLSAAAMRAYFERRYSPHNVVLAAAGRIDFDALVRRAEASCGHWTPTLSQRPLMPASGGNGLHVMHKPSATQQYVLRLSSGPGAEDADRFAAKLLGTVLGDETGSRLYWELVDPGLAESASLSHYEHQQAGLMVTYMSCDPDVAAENLAKILELYRDVAEGGVSEAELDQAKSKLRSRIVLSSERPRGRLFVVGSDWIYRRVYRPVEVDLEAVAGVTRESTAAVLEKHPLAAGVTMIVGPLESLDAN